MAEKKSTELRIAPDTTDDEWTPRFEGEKFWLLVLTRVYAFIPSLIPKFMKRGGLRRSEKLRSTSYLDALRGVAAVIVVNHHHQSNPSEYWFLSLIWAGKSSVNVFFVISGYVLSYRLLKFMRARDSAALIDGFASSMFRRYIRLYFSAFAASFIAMIMVRKGRLGYVHRFDYLSEQLWDWMGDCLTLGNPFQGPRGYKIAFDNSYASHYLDPLWTIPVEFRGSIVLYCFCLATCKMSTLSRMIVCCGLIVLSYMWHAIYIALFLGGCFIADLNLSRSAAAKARESEQLGPVKDAAPQKSIRERVGWIVVFVFALFLLSQPDNYNSEVWPWPYLKSKAPKHMFEEHHQLAQHYYLSIGAILLVCALDNYPALQTPLCWDFPQYLGEVSFGMYVMHVLLMWGFWNTNVEPFRVAHLGGSWLACNGVYVAYFALILWAGELFSRIDSKVVRLGRWLQRIAFAW
jgi:peptidoglycan/LPS O-acetylase OafA/YrhL